MGFSYGPLVGIKKNPKQLKRVFVYYAKKRVIKGYKISPSLVLRKLRRRRHHYIPGRYNGTVPDLSPCRNTTFVTLSLALDFCVTIVKVLSFGDVCRELI